VKVYETNNLHILLFHLGNIIQLVRDVRSEVNLKRLEIRDLKLASLIKKHVFGAEL
jgi:hypothetical protein